MPLHITVWGINYTPEVTGIGPYNSDLCQYLADAGHSVHMVTTFPYYPSWKKNPCDRKRIYCRKNLNGVTIHRCWHYVPSNPTALKRILHEASFVAVTFVRVLLLPRPDALFVIAPPLLSGPAAWLISRLKRCPFFFHVQDMQPDAALSMGMLKAGLLSHILYKIEAFTYKRAKGVSGITRGMLELFKKKNVPLSRQYFFPNWILDRENDHVRGHDTDESTNPKNALFRSTYGIPATDFLVIYSGNLGRKQGLDVIVEAAEEIQRIESLNRTPEPPGLSLPVAKENTRHQVSLVIAGDGGERKALSELVASKRLRNIRLLPLQPDRFFHAMVREADLCLVTQKTESGALFFPSKLLTLLDAEKPVYTVSDEHSDLHQAVQAGKFGKNILPGNTAGADLAKEIIYLAEHRWMLEPMAKAGKQWVSRFARHHVLCAFETHLQREVLEKEPGGRILRLPLK